MSATITFDCYGIAIISSLISISLFTLGFTLGSIATAYKTSMNPVLEDYDVTPPHTEAEEESQSSQGSVEETAVDKPPPLARNASFRPTPALTADSLSPDSPRKHAKGRHEWECVRTVLLRGQALTLTQLVEALVPPLYTGEKPGKIIAPHYLKWSLHMGLIEILQQE